MKNHFGSRQKAVLMLCDLAFLLLSFPVAQSLRLGLKLEEALTAPTLWFAVAFVLFGLYVGGSYDLEERRTDRSVFLRVSLSIFAGFVALTTLTYLVALDRAGIFGRGVLGGALALSCLLSWGLRVLWGRRVEGSWKDWTWLFIGEGAEADGILRQLREEGLPGRFEEVSIEAPKFPSERSFDAVILQASPEHWEKNWGDELVMLRLKGLPVLAVSDVYEIFWRKIPVRTLEPRWFLQLEGFGLVNSLPWQRLKRISDLFAALVLIMLTWPLMVLTALAVRLDSRGPAIYRQVRTGKGGRTFRICKFRSMRIDAETQGAQWARQNDDRITRVGRFIRKTRLDELPQLWNVLTGDMSFIGPRPERPEFNEDLARVIPYYNLRHLVRPGVTGWAQVSYPYGASVEDSRRKLEFDLYYIKHFSLILDLKILLKTIRVVLFAAGR